LEVLHHRGSAMSSQHVVQFYDADESALVYSVGRYVTQALDAGESVVLITNRERQNALLAIFDRLRGEPEVGTEDGRLVLLDAERTLDEISVGGRLSARRFDEVVGGTLREVVSRSRSRRVRAYGDMVDILWQRGRRDDAIELERLWNDLQAQLPFDLYCAYNVDLFGEDFDPDALASVLCEHSGVVPRRANSELQCALDYAMYETLGGDRPRLSDTETTILWLREHIPHQAPKILDRARRYAKGLSSEL
jgi:hypothetical protein